MVNEVDISRASFLVMNNFSVEIPNIKSIYLDCWTAVTPLFGTTHSFTKGSSRAAQQHQQHWGLYPSQAGARAGRVRHPLFSLTKISNRSNKIITIAMQWESLLVTERFFCKQFAACQNPTGKIFNFLLKYRNQILVSGDNKKFQIYQIINFA